MEHLGCGGDAEGVRAATDDLGHKGLLQGLQGTWLDPRGLTPLPLAALAQIICTPCDHILRCDCYCVLRTAGVTQAVSVSSPAHGMGIGLAQTGSAARQECDDDDVCVRVYVLARTAMLSCETY